MAAGPFGLEIERGSPEERFRAWIAEVRAELAATPRLALLVEEGAEPLAAWLEPFADELEIVRLEPVAAPLHLSALLEPLAALAKEKAFSFVALAGRGERADARQAAWRLGELARARWLFLRSARSAPGALEPLRAHVSRYLEIIDGLAYHEGRGG